MVGDATPLFTTPSPIRRSPIRALKILVIGGGGREHALVWKLKQSPRVTEMFCAPGNAGIAQLATCLPIKVTELESLLAFARDAQIGLTVVGPDDVLAAGIVDLFEANGLRIFGPTKAAAQLESSKVFAKDFMQRHGIPTARSGCFSDSAAARKFIQTMSFPVVVKADGLALGKGVIIAENGVEADAAIHDIMDARKFGDAGSRVVIEEFLTGEECSIHALVDGASYLLFPARRITNARSTAISGRTPAAWARSVRRRNCSRRKWKRACDARCSIHSSPGSRRMAFGIAACFFPD